MPKRLVDGEALWTSRNLKALPKADPLALLIYCWLLPIAEANGVFEYDVEMIHTRTMLYHDIVSKEDLEDYLSLYREYGFLFVWTHYGKEYGFWVNMEKRLPKTKYVSKEMPDPPRSLLERYISASRKKLNNTEYPGKSLYQTPIQDSIEIDNLLENEEDTSLPTSNQNALGLDRLGKVRGNTATDLESSLAERQTGEYRKDEFSYVNKKPDSIYSLLVEKWGEAVGAGAVCKKPHQQGWTWFADTCKATEADTLVPAFELWASEHAEPGNHTPIGDFLRNMAEYTQRLVQKAPENALEALGREESIRRDLEAAKAVNDACRAQESQGESLEELLARAEKQLD